MTREEAIKHIITYAYYEDDIPFQVATAMDRAISALRAQQEQERNEPLTLDELRRMDGKTWLAYRHQLKNTTEG